MMARKENSPAVSSAYESSIKSVSFLPTYMRGATEKLPLLLSSIID